MTKVKDLVLTGDIVYPLTDKGFKIVSIPEYVMVKDNKTNQDIEKPKMQVKLMENELVLDYYPNKSSMRKLTAQFGIEMDDWEGKVAEFNVLQQNVAGQIRNVLYVK